MQALDILKESALRSIESATDTTALRDIEIAYLGRSGKVTSILRGVKDLSPDQRKHIGREANLLRSVLEDVIAEKRRVLNKQEHAERLGKERIDITQPGVKMPRGGLHPLTIIRRDIERIFSSLGFTIAVGQEVETEHYNFDALNIPADHPARDMWDTFWIKQKKDEGQRAEKERLLLRTHTSPVQVRYLEAHQPPFRIIVPGRAFRYEATDASHEIQLYQLEGLMVGEDVSLGHFKYIITTFLSELFQKEVTIRLRPSYFPFVEPGVEVDMSCVICGGKKGCSVCKRTGWVEILGAGMVHPYVFKAAGLNPKYWQGFAFGMGIDRVAMMKYHIPDIRFFHAGDERFLKQF
ncbi:MAG: phenylalanine--tRNA ligase subunit alpha [Candidatus Ryanbacteria bacterium CG10_big_fil_rev_8_21_14_0_10_43_42]|uniref:Phenylalanine--tRNA ligase alpha subunit n=1 Tax=Candidatus Ryanbacteria bacterium CG10_big_fil_rev_8_21_14_0_10_43_42 TaxID=1974864 RepID=A0A2M8KYE0_9BACT|nr:MAG: phenylalanine--tRNA ligase subunit alpha [Candidatus Ryanbacteria bacterium CG10_big_fil_rev_8_21_14_0_10_43_42]